MSLSFSLFVKRAVVRQKQLAYTISVKQKLMNQCLSWRFRGIHLVMNIVVRLDYVLYDPTFYNECALGCASL